MRFFVYLIGITIRAFANQIDEAQVAEDGAPSLNPTHTQLAKDHDDHPLHTLAARCAMSAVKNVGALMAAAWQRPAAEREAIKNQLLDRAESYFVHPELILREGPPPAHLAEIMSIVREFADNPANAAALLRAEKRTVLDEHLREAQKFAERVTKQNPFERLRQIFEF